MSNIQNGSHYLDLDGRYDGDPTLSWCKVFANNHPVEIEIGIGKGRFLIDAVERQPEVNFIGVEWAAKYLRLAHDRMVKKGFENIRFIRADAREFVEFFVPTASVQAYHIYFPDPWPKKKHHKRRLIDEEFLEEVERTLEPRGKLRIATDHTQYYEAVLEVLEKSRWLREIEGHWDGRRTNYEEKFIDQGKPIHRKVMER
jgi:tRNA (guanine-N7-)-methyltransferase